MALTTTIKMTMTMTMTMTMIMKFVNDNDNEQYGDEDDDDDDEGDGDNYVNAFAAERQQSSRGGSTYLAVAPAPALPLCDSFTPPPPTLPSPQCR